MLEDKYVVIFGGDGVIGRDLTVSALKNAARVVVASRSVNDTMYSSIEENHRSKLHLASVDVTNPESVHEFFKEYGSSGQRIDAVVNCTYPRSENYGARFEDVDFNAFSENIRLHLGGAFIVCQKAAAYFEQHDRGNIINFASIYGLMTPVFEIYEGTSMTKEVEYIMSKSAIIHFTKYLAKYLKGKNIRVNCISPGGIFNDESPIFVEKYNALCLNKGMLDAKDIAGAFLFLVSDLSRHINGQNIVVDDGFSL